MQISASAAALAEVTCEVGLEPAHPVQQHRDRRRLGEPFQVVDVAGRGQLQRGHRVLPLAAQVQPLPAGGKQSQQRTLREERSERRTRVEDVLHVVHDDQEVLLRHGGEDPVRQRPARRVA